MEITTIEVSLPTEMLHNVERIASKRNISLDKLLEEMLSQLIQHDESYAAARSDHLSIMAEGYDLGTHGKPTWTRDDLHERW